MEEWIDFRLVYQGGIFICNLEVLMWFDIRCLQMKMSRETRSFSSINPL